MCKNLIVFILEWFLFKSVLKLFNIHFEQAARASKSKILNSPQVSWPIIYSVTVKCLLRKIKDKIWPTTGHKKIWSTSATYILLKIIFLNIQLRNMWAQLWIESTDVNTHVHLTFWGPYIAIYSYNKSQQDALFLKFIFIKNSACFAQIYCPSPGVSTLYTQQ